MPTLPSAGPTSTPAKAAGSQWWAVPATGPSSRISPGYQIVNGTAAAVRQQFGAVAGILGPFATEAAARGAVGTAGIPSGAASLPRILSIPEAIFAGAHWFGDLVTHLTDLAMWRSLGWALLGVILLVAGLAMWFRQSELGQDMRTVAATAATAAV